jgi:PBSX family phage portal protein
MGENEVVDVTPDPLAVAVTKKILGAGDESADVQRSNLLDLSDAMAAGFGRAGALSPPLDPLALTRMTGMSSTLRPLLDAMAVNVHGFGYYFEPVVDLDSSDTIDRVRAAMLLEAELEAEQQAGEGEEPAEVDEPSDDDVKQRIESLRAQARREKAQLEAFFANASRKVSFTRLSRKMQTDKESTGWGVVEVRRDGRGRVSRLGYAPSWTFRALPLGKPVEVDCRVRATDVSYRSVKEVVRFRRYVQIYETVTRYFKEFGDPRAMSAATGRFYDSVKHLAKAEGAESLPATEVLWFNLDSSESDVYGSVRWSGCIPGVIGSREQAEVNLLFFRSKAIPPMIMLVSGGKLAKGARDRLEQTIRNEIKGVENFHKIMVIEAESGARGMAASGLPSQDKVKIELRPLTDAIFKDALWQGYAEANRAELGQSFRIPPMLRGDTTNLNRATAKVARETTEQLVFSPERRDFEFDIDRTLLTDMGVMLWRFRLNTPESTDAETLVAFTTKLLEGTVTVNEARRVVSRILGIELPPLDADWARMPIKPALAGLQPEPLPEDVEEEPEQDEAPPAETDGEGEGEKAEEPDVVKLRLSQREFESLFDVNGTP